MLVGFLCVLLLNGFLIMNKKPAEGGVIVNVVSMSDDAIDVDEFFRNLPPNLKSHSHQAGGHVLSVEHKSIGMLEDDRGSLLKPKDEGATNEMKFYEEVKKGSHPILATLIPEYRGIVSLPYRNKTLDFLTLEDLARGFKKPCVMDLKIGKKTWGPEANDKKINSEMSKCSALKKLYGFAMPGYLVTNPETNKVTKFTRQICRSLTPEDLVNAIENFVNTTGDKQVTAALVKCIIGKLEPIIAWAATQKELRLRASSILILYDSQELLNLVPVIKKNSDISLDFVRVKMVDFAHVYKAAPNDPGIDLNYLKGAVSVLEIFHDILEKYTTST